MEIVASNCPMSHFVQPACTHEYDEVILCRSGWGILIVEGQEHRIEEGELACIPAGTLHADRAPVPRQNGHVYLHGAGEAGISRFCIYRDRDGTFGRLLDLAAEALMQNEPGQRLFAYALGDAMVQLLQCWGAASHAMPNDAVGGIDRLIRRNFADAGFDLAGEIEKTGYSPGYFRRIFRETVGRPPQAQLNHVRIEYAKSQMRIYRSASSIKLISQSAGFRDPYYFSRMFKLSEGISPTEYLHNIGA